MKKFTKKDLINKLGYTQEEAKLIMEAQKKFPELLTMDNDIEGFVIDARNLWRQLGEPQGRFNDWVNRKILKRTLGKNEKDILMFKKNVDFISFTQKCVNPNGGRPDVEYSLTLDCAKKISMKEDTVEGNLCADYFILMEKAVKKMCDWIVIREPQKEGFRKMCSALDNDYRETHDGKSPNSFLYSNNADMINLCLLGVKSKKAKEILGIEYNEPLRDNLTQEYNQALYMIQEFNSGLLASHMDYQDRKTLVQNMCNVNYADLKERIRAEFAKELGNEENN